MWAFTFLNTGGAPISSRPPVSVFSGISEPQMQRKCAQPVDNAWLPSDPRVKLLSGLRRPGAPFQGMESCQPAVSLPGQCIQHRDAYTPSRLDALSSLCVPLSAWAGLGDCASRHWASYWPCFCSCQLNLISLSAFPGKQICCLSPGPSDPGYFDWCLLRRIIIYFRYYAIAARVFTVCWIIGKWVVYQANIMRLVSQSQRLWAPGAIKEGRGRKMQAALMWSSWH